MLNKRISYLFPRHSICHDIRHRICLNPENICCIVIVGILMQLRNNATRDNYPSPYMPVFFAVQQSSRIGYMRIKRIRAREILHTPKSCSTAARNWGICTDGSLIARLISSYEFYSFSILCRSPCSLCVLQFSVSSASSTLLCPLSTTLIH